MCAEMADTPVSDLVDSQQIAERLGVERKTVTSWVARTRLGFPEAKLRRDRCAFWAWPEVEAWARRTGRLPDGSP